jgi:DNA-binding response OmpR family regulator
MHLTTNLTLEPAHLLIIEDHMDVLEMLRDYFGGDGYRVTCASDAASGLQAVRSERPDLVLLDLALPDLHGETVLLRFRVLFPDVPVVLVTANADAALAKRLLRLGAFDYIPKPFDFGHLARIVAVALSLTPLPIERPRPGGEKG